MTDQAKDDPKRKEIKTLDDLHRAAKDVMAYVTANYAETEQELVLHEAARYLRLRGLHDQD